jgi:uncharacterized protein YaiI (UPF0178 family)
MKIWVDADSVPVRVREIIIKACRREGVNACFVANREIPLDDALEISSVIVPATEGSADAYILAEVLPEDLVVTRDIPLAADLVEKKIVVLNDRGRIYTPENVRERLSMRNFMKDLREQGLPIDKAGKFGPKEVQEFANAFDRELRKKLKQQK